MKCLIPTLALALLATTAQAQLTVKATNKLDFARADQTIELTAKDLAPLNVRDLMTVHVKDSSGKELVAQAVDTDFDARHIPDMVIFQANFGPGESKTFTVSTGPKQVYTEEQFRARGRFVRERFDDFAWENDRIAHRMYGKGLESWEGEPLTSSTIDVWSKRTPKMVLDKWYMVDNYHVDHGEGADFYSAGRSRGVGGNGIWANGQLFTSKNFVQSRVLANGPVRLLFELEYEPFEVGGAKVSEVKRISLDGGSNLDRFQSTYKVVEGNLPMPLTMGIGLKKVNGETREYNKELGWLAKWERMEKNAGMQGLAAIADPQQIVEQTEDNLNLLLLTRTNPQGVATYYAGFCWDKGGQFTNFDEWKAYLTQFAKSVQSPIEVSVGQ